MFSKIFVKPKTEDNCITSLDKWLDEVSPRSISKQTLEILEKKERVFVQKAAAELERAKEFARVKNKKAASQCLERKRLYEDQVYKLGNFQMRVQDQMILLEAFRCSNCNPIRFGVDSTPIAPANTVDALRTGAAAMKSMQKATNIDDIDKTMDAINEQTENMKQIHEALATPIGGMAGFDEDALLEELEGAELEDELLKPILTPPATNHVQVSEADQIAALKADMALSEFC